MSSRHLIIVARNVETNEMELCLDNMTLYGTGGEDDVVKTCAKCYDDKWVLSLYEPIGDMISGSGRKSI